MDLRSAWQRYDAEEQRLTAHVSERMLDLAGLRPGSRVLDIASGRGEPALRAAIRVGPHGHVVATDPSDAMLDFARARATASSITNMSFRTTDAETLAGVDAQAFDAALCRWGVMFFEDPQAALLSASRCLMPGARLVAAVWGEPAQVPWWQSPREVLARHAPLPAVSPAGDPCRYGTPGTLEDELVATGFAVEHLEQRFTSLTESTTPQGLVDWCLAFGLADRLAAEPPAVSAAWMRDMTIEATQRRDADGTYRLGGVTRIIVARSTTTAHA